jgi:hypothetical protein
MTRTSLLIIAASVLALSGCASTDSAPTKVDTGPIRARTFSFVDRGPRPAPPATDTRTVVHSMIQEAVTKNLAARGVTRVATGGEVTVAYLLIVGNNVSTRAISDYFGYRDDAFSLSEQAFDAYRGSKNPNYFEAGTLLIDVIDSKGFKLRMRNYATRPVLRDLPADARAARIQEVVDEIFRDVRIAP